MKAPPANVTLHAEEGEALVARVHQSDRRRADAETVAWVMRMYFHVGWAIEEGTLPLRQLRSFLVGTHAYPLPEQSLSASDVAGVEAHGCRAVKAEAEARATPAQVPPVASQKPEPSRPKGGPRPGAGRRGAEAYAGATRVECRHDELAGGQRCPGCGPGTLYPLPAGVEIRIDGHAWLSALRYELAKLRCSAWGEIFTAGVPEGVGDEKSSAQGRAVLAVSRYCLGGPGYRLQGDQALLGVPVADAPQGDQSEVVGDCAYKVCQEMEREAAQGPVSFQDDTAVRIVSLRQENRALAQAQAHGLAAPTARPGMHTTALAVQVGAHTALLYYSSRRQAGENLQALLDKREAGWEKPLAMSDALTSNEVADESLLIRCHCLAHGRRKFSDLAEVFPHECRVVRDVIGQVFDHDEQARKEQMSPEARLAYQQADSRPLMDELKGWLDQQVHEHLVEPHSSLGKAIASMRTPWQTLTRF